MEMWPKGALAGRVVEQRRPDPRVKSIWYLFLAGKATGTVQRDAVGFWKRLCLSSTSSANNIRRQWHLAVSWFHSGPWATGCLQIHPLTQHSVLLGMHGHQGHSHQLLQVQSMHRILPQQLLADIWENAATALRREFRRFCINDSGDKGWKRGGLVEGSSVAIAAKLVEQHAERPEVCFLGVVMEGPRRLLWREVPWGTAEERCARMPAWVASDLCEAEVPMRTIPRPVRKTF